MPLDAPDSPVLGLRHPMPDLQSLQGAYVGNINRLEERAERMSESGSDIGEEIRKLQIEQKLSDSRRSSMRSTYVDERAAGSRSRNASTSSYSRSIVDVNGTARWGGYSPGGYVTSPGGSLKSGSFSNPPPSQRQRSGTGASRLGQVVHAGEEHSEQQTTDTHPGSPPLHDTTPRAVRRDSSPPPPSHRSVSSFTKTYDMISQEIQEQFHQIPAEGVPSGHGDDAHRYDENYYPAQQEYLDRPATAASTDTTHQARTLWQDFDGVHCPDTVPEEESNPSLGTRSRNSSMLKSVPEVPAQGAPPPSDDMVFYPAPVPKMLNLPKRLSKVPAAAVQARRRTQLLETMQPDNRKSVGWAPDGTPESPERNRASMMDPRKSRASMANLPPQLRASAYFDQVGPAQEFEVKGESAEDTLDNILEASARAPVSAFTDHPFAGHVGDEVYGKEHHRKSSSALNLDKYETRKSRASINNLDKFETRKSRSSINLLDTNRNSSGDPLNKLKKRNSAADLNVLTVRATESRMSLGDELDEPDHDARGPDDATPRRRSFDGHSEHSVNFGDDMYEDEEAREGAEDEGEEEEEEEQQYFGPPTTLLAELQMRKQQQKTRKLTAATAFPNGMHSTLLQLDAVAEIEKTKRKNQKVNLAWEGAPPQNPDDDSDEDVPLGVLFPGRDGLVNKKNGNGARNVGDWDRPLGLMAKRAIEDNEPLSQRRNRLLGVVPGRQVEASASQQHLAVPVSTTPGQESEEDEGETLAQRVQRLKSRQALDDALGADVRKSHVSGDFAAEMMTQFGDPEDPDKPKASPSPGVEGEETLGQRRARLQVEAMAEGGNVKRSAGIQSSMSMADILGANPIDNTNQARKISNDMLLSALPQNSLLAQNEAKQSRRQAERLDRTRRISSFGSLDKPLVGNQVNKQDPDQALAAKISAYKNNLAGTPNMPMAQQSMPGMMYNPAMHGGLTPAMSSMHLPGQRESYFPQPAMGMPNQMPMGMGMGMNGMTMTPNAYGYPQGNMMPQQMIPQQRMGMNMGMGVVGMQMNGMGMPGMSPYGQMNGMGGMGVAQASNPNLQMQMQMGMFNPMMDPMVDAKQREMIDQWRSGVMH
ncbi:hypothetical protein P154DRAFT_519932 [Amniculicola lignicola CBS 123094]|uniref:Uncharacterized protein n=1 Tax=Amniculicola lignicola CBS 123094 TaxID=1392246 RepID=A0A6A5WPB8_9PLEO|nr:hypothetical protein P154DRAFT_519932 [Amniculicola lignicola CBS 123094]